MYYFIGNSFCDPRSIGLDQRWGWVPAMNYLSRRVCTSNSRDSEYDNDEDTLLDFYQYSDCSHNWGIRLDNAIVLKVKRTL